MNPDNLEQVWQSQLLGQRLTINADVLLQQVARNQRHLESLILWRDVREIGLALVMVPVWIWLGVSGSLPWTWYLCIPALLWIAGFMLVDRIRQRARKPKPGDPLRQCLTSSLSEVEHQIWLLRNVGWWYLLPPGAAIAAFFAQCAWNAKDGGWAAGLILAGAVAVGALILAGVYWLNQVAVRDELEPRRRELQGLIANLDGANQDTPSPEAAASSAGSRRSGVVYVILSALVLTALVQVVYRFGQANGREAGSPTSAARPAAGDPAVTNLLVAIQQKHSVPAISAAIVTSQGLTTVGVAGVRKRGADAAATLDDLWHLGSDTKAMTATLVAKLVEQKKLKWETTVAEVFPELAEKFHPDFRGVTLLHLLAHRSGLRPNLDLGKYRGDDVRSERLRAVREELARKPSHAPGSHYEYSNLGYIIAGAVVERITGQSWEAAIRAEVFEPLKMTSVGFGGTGTPGQIDQPWPHTANGKPMPQNGSAMDNPPVMGPAGRVHCTIQDWAKFIQDQLRGARGEPALLSAASYQKLHTPPFGGEYALGWLVVQRDWAGGLALNHGGDNTMNFANVWLAPQRDFALLACVNQSGDKGFQASDAAVGALIQLHQSRRSTK